MTDHVDFPPNPAASSPGPAAARPERRARPEGLGALGDARVPLVAWSGPCEKGAPIGPLAHPRALLALGFDGLMRVETGDDRWFIPDRHGIWIPPGLRYTLMPAGGIELQTFYIHPRHAARSGLPDRPVVVRATPLLRGIARRLAPGAEDRLSAAERRRLAWVALDELGRLERPDLHLPGARDPRLAAAMAHLLARPQDAQNLAWLAASVGTSERTLARLFRAETGLNWREWRERMRFMLAIEGLQLGQGSSEIAARLGYSSPSAFIAAFRRHIGVPPSEWRRRR